MVKGTVHNESDIDVAYLSDNKVLDRYEIFMISQDLAAKLGRDVDLIDLNQASTVFQAQVLHTGKVIYCTDEGKKAKYELKTLKMYTKLNEERFPILKRIDESGSVYEK
jgi:predicted nucleotidyltransferase